MRACSVATDQQALPRLPKMLKFKPLQDLTTCHIIRPVEADNAQGSLMTVCSKDLHMYLVTIASNGTLLKRP